MSIVREGGYRTKKFYIADSSMRCFNIVIQGDDLHVGCISAEEENFQICSLNYDEETQSQCKFYNLDWDIELEFDELIAEFRGKRTMMDTIYFTLLLKPKNADSLVSVRSFFIFAEGWANRVTVPLANVNIRHVDIVSINLSLGIVHVLIGVQNGKTKDLVAFKLNDFIVDKDSLEKGLVSQNVMSYIIQDQNITTFSIEMITNKLVIQQMNIDILKIKEYSIPNQIELIEMLGSGHIIMVTTRNTKFIRQTYLVDLNNSRLFNWNLERRQESSQGSLISFNNRVYLWMFNFDIDLDEFQCKLIHIQEFYSMTIRFDRHFGKSFDKEAMSNSFKVGGWKEERKKMPELNDFRGKNEGFDVIEAYVDFFNKKQKVASLSLIFTPQKYVFNKFRESSLQARIYGRSSLYIMLFGNNLEVNPRDPNIIYFNEIPLELTEFKNTLKHEEILFSFMYKYSNFVTKSGKFYYSPYKTTNMTKPFTIKLHEYTTLNLPDWMLNFDSQKIEYVVLFDNYVLVLFDKRRLYALNINSMMSTVEDIDEDQQVDTRSLYELELPENKMCQLMDTLVYCFNDLKKMEMQGIDDDNDEGKGKIYFNVRLLGELVVIEEVFTFIPEMSNLIMPFSFYYSSFTEGQFTFLQKGNKNYEIVQCNRQGIEKVVPVHFINDMNKSSVDFMQVLYGYQLIIIYKDTLEVWVANDFRIMRYPDKHYLQDYKEYITTKVMMDSHIFLVLYRTMTDKIRGLLYRVDNKPFYRLVKEFELDSDNCANSNIRIMSFLILRYTYLSYFCYGTNKKMRTWKYTGVLEMNLVVDRSQIYYRVQVGSKIEKNISLTNLNYYKHFRLQAKEVVLPEENTHFQIYDLEANSTLKIRGDVLGIKQVEDHPFVTFFPRIQLNRYFNLDHEFEINENQNFTIKRLAKFNAMIVTDEYVVRGQDIQNNNFYNDCQSLRSFVTNEEDQKFKDVYICNEKETNNFFITDFHQIKISIEIDRKRLINPHFLKIRDFIYLIAQLTGSDGVSIYKFTYNQYTCDTLKPIYTAMVAISDFSSNLHGLDYFFPFYHEEHDLIYLLLKEMHSTAINLRSLSIDDNQMDFINMQWLTFVDGTKKKIYFTFCKSKKGEVICTGRTTKKLFIIRIFLEIDWKIEILYRMNPHYTLPSISSYPVSYLHDEFMAIVFQTLNVVDRMQSLANDKKWPLINLYRMKQESKEGVIYGVLFWEDFLSEDIGNIFIIKDVLLLKDPLGNVKMVVNTLTSTSDNPDSPNRLRIYEFEISTFRIRYDLRSLRFRDSVEVVGFDYDSNVEKISIPILIKKNQRIFMYMVLNMSLLLILAILVIVIIYFYAQNKKRLGDSLASETNSVESYNVNENEDSFEAESSDNHYLPSEERSEMGFEDDSVDNSQSEKRNAPKPNPNKPKEMVHPARVESVIDDESN